MLNVNVKNTFLPIKTCFSFSLWGTSKYNGFRNHCTGLYCRNGPAESALAFLAGNLADLRIWWWNRATDSALDPACSRDKELRRLPIADGGPPGCGDIRPPPYRGPPGCGDIRPFIRLAGWWCSAGGGCRLRLEENDAKDSVSVVSIPVRYSTKKITHKK